MKYFFLSIIFVGFACVTHAQSNVNPRYNLRQKQFLDSLRNAHKQPIVMIASIPKLVYYTPVVPLSDEGEKTGMSGEDTIYQMKTDNMRLLKPNKNTTSIPVAAEGKILMISPAEAKP